MELALILIKKKGFELYNKAGNEDDNL